MSRSLGLAEPPGNSLRFRPGCRGHVESYFLRANHPTRPLALWLKATLFAPRAGEPQAEAWVIWFDGERRRTFTHRETVPLGSASFVATQDGVDIQVWRSFFSLGANGKASGEMKGRDGEAAWRLTWEAEPFRLGQPLSLYPYRLLRQGPFPKLKLLTPYPLLTFSGEIRINDERVPVDGWTGMQGHNWGKEHLFDYVWGQCQFPRTATTPTTVVEGGSGRAKVGGVVLPRMSMVVVRRGEEAWHFDRVFDLWRQEATVDRWRWTMHLRGAAGEVDLTMDAEKMPLACLGYRNPDGRLSYCFNTKLAHVWLNVQPRRGRAFQAESEHGGALEFLRNEPDREFPDVV